MIATMDPSPFRGMCASCLDALAGCTTPTTRGTCWCYSGTSTEPQPQRSEPEQLNRKGRRRRAALDRRKR